MKEECVRRDTRQRRAVRRVLEAADRPLSPQEILEAAQIELPQLGIATVYRSVKTLVEDGILEPVELPGEGQRYEIAGKHHHHHFHCNGCGKVFEVEGCGMAAILIRTSVMKDVFETQKALFAPIPGYGEDVSFCLRARKAGYRIWCDSRVKIGHVASTIVTEETFRAWKKKREEAENGG